ncbi:hypothetical protein NDI76_19345 [Halogeometricum sp. S1BR25-6]|uniref:DUF91 domain-containing protein n=1 Tax=Halogeometricum salsisoli TaxID=2950536 RepID=A0ABU2GJ99_9EURY|nr:hypothetical protein [Halogeometricum sp. S1BR25-6]MDS0300907.1 hypothetical protein [Halogeometricum sp. S1BR25-6]
MAEDGLTQLRSDELSSEATIENWLSKGPGITIGGIDIFLVHQQGHTDQGQRYDLIGVDKKGNTVTLELKHNRSPRKMVAQAVEYASDHHQWEQPYATLEHKFQSYIGRTDSLRKAHADYFDLDNPRPETAFNNDQKIILLAGRFSDRVLSVARYLQDKDHSIFCIEYSVYSEEESRILTTRNVLTEDSETGHSETDGKPSPDPKYRTPTFQRVFDQIQAEVVDELGGGTIDDPTELLNKLMEDLNSLALVSHHPNGSSDHLDDDEQFAFSFNVLPTRGILRISVQRRYDEVTEEILKSYQDEVRSDFEYKSGIYRTILKEADIDSAVAGINWDTTTPEKIADAVLADETVNQYIEEYVEMIKLWHPRIVEAYPEALAEYNSEQLAD